MKFILLATCLCFFSMAVAQNQVGIFENAKDIGDPESKGSASYDDVTQTYTITGGGYNIWFERDEFQYLYNSIEGDFILTANFEFVGQGTDPHRKVGWMIRESDDENAAHVSATLHGDGLTVMQWRELRGAFMRDPEDEIFPPKSNYGIMQLERAGNTIIMRAAHWGEPLQLIGSHEMADLPETVLAGLFVGSHNPDILETAKVWNVRIDKPVGDDYSVQQSGWLGCRLEIINPFDGMRKVIYEKNDRFEAPNYMPDGKKLIFNMEGSLYKIPIGGGELEKLNTGSASRLNNDHGISFDGKTLAISHNAGEGSAVFVLPLEGGEPKRVTEETPSYWHGWNPNNKSLVYVARRNGSNIYNVYEATIKDGKETALTTFDYGHVDGPEYSPDGKYVYYNGSQSGTMQLWRMKPDGSEREQLTFDERNDWFPHISPDGKWILYISFPSSNPVDGHPSYKRVTLKLMPADGGESKTVAYLYGGQGTINVPSWSPDSKYVAFVSNSGRK